MNAPEEQDSDQIYALKGDIRVLEDALMEAQDNNKQLVAEFTILNDNSEIEKSTTKYASRLIIVVPLICMFLLLISANDGVVLSVNNGWLSIWWNISLYNYTQGALVVGSVAFMATILGFLLNGVFGVKKGGEATQLVEMAGILKDYN